MSVPNILPTPTGRLVEARIKGLRAEADHILEACKPHLSPDQISLLTSYRDNCDYCLAVMKNEPTIDCVNDEDTDNILNSLSDPECKARNAIVNFARVFLTLPPPSSYICLPSDPASTADSVVGAMLHTARSLTSDSPIITDTIAFLTALYNSPFSIAESTITVSGEELSVSVLLAHLSPTSSASGGVPIAILGNADLAEILQLSVKPATPDSDGFPLIPFSFSSLSPADVTTLLGVLAKDLKNKRGMERCSTIVKIDG